MSPQNEIVTLSGQAQIEDVFARISWFSRRQVEQATVMVVGCGALGNEVLKNLALFGVGRIIVVDFDRVEPHNLTRSVLFTMDDALQKRKKVTVAAERLRMLNPAVEVVPLDADITWQVGLGWFLQANVVVGCLDNRWARYILNRLAMRAGVPWIDGGIEGLEGVAKVFIPGKNCYACTMDPSAYAQIKQRVSCADRLRRDQATQHITTTPIVASIIGAVQAQEALKLIHADKLASGQLSSLCGKMFYYEGEHLTSRLVEHQAWDSDCPEHDTWQSIVPIYITTAATVAQTLEACQTLLQAQHVEIILHNFCWVDFIECQHSGQVVSAQLPDALVPDFVQQHPQLRHVLPAHLYQREYHSLDKHFPYQNLTLAQIGIPDNDVLHVVSEKGETFVLLNRINKQSDGPF